MDKNEARKEFECVTADFQRLVEKMKRLPNCGFLAYDAAKALENCKAQKLLKKAYKLSQEDRRLAATNAHYNPQNKWAAFICVLLSLAAIMYVWATGGGNP